MPATLTIHDAAQPHDAVSNAPARASLARVDICDTLDAAMRAWRLLETTGLSTPYQSYNLLASWYRYLGNSEGARAAIVIGYDTQNEPLMVMPLAVTRRAGIRVAEFFGGKHVSFNMPLWRKDFAASATARDLQILIESLQTRDIADVLALTRQPFDWGDIANPMALWPKTATVNDCPRLVLTADAPPDAGVSPGTRKRLRKKENKLKSLPGYRYTCASNVTDAKRVLEMFFAVKPQRMAEAGLPDVFSGPEVQSFLRGACLAEIDRTPAIELHALECDEEVIAMFAVAVNPYRVSTMFNALSASEHVKYSPGLILLREIIDHYVARGHRVIDFGIGDDGYKRMFCKDDEPMFDSFVALNARGRITALVLTSLTRVKRVVKTTPALKRIATAIRAYLPN